MNLFCSPALGSRYSNKAQIARIVTESWFAQQMYCLACSSNCLTQKPANYRAVDFGCPNCTALYQVKSRKTALTNRIVDASYRAMLEAIRSEQVPNLALLQYSPSWHVLNVILIPDFFLTESAIEERKPTLPRGRGKPWVGCNIVLTNIPDDGRIPVVWDGRANDREQVRELYRRVQPLRALGRDVRGWTLDVLNVLRKLSKEQVLLSDVYEFEGYLQHLHPDNQHVRAKIRQQLQILRDIGYLAFCGNGRYRVL